MWEKKSEWIIESELVTYNETNLILWNRIEITKRKIITSVCSENYTQKNVKQLKKNVILKEISLENVSFVVYELQNACYMLVPLN